MKEIYTQEIANDQPGVYHIPGVHNGQQTLCGWVDASGSTEHRASDHPCNCSPCIDAYRKIKALTFPSGYFAKG
jgi:hypothetical protein